MSGYPTIKMFTESVTMFSVGVFMVKIPAKYHNLKKTNAFCLHLDKEHLNIDGTTKYQPITHILQKKQQAMMQI